MKNKRRTLCHKSLDYLTQHKVLFGFADWTMHVIDSMDLEKEDAIAEIQIDFFEKEATITLYEPYLEKKNWKNILLHELIHGRIALMNAQHDYATGKIKYLFEEQCVNDITRGMEEALGKR